MKALRVLTGTHAGAQIRLTVGTYLLSAGADADICISDWQVDALSLTLGEDGVTRVRLDGAEEVLIADFIAVPYGDVVFCVGPDDAHWPRDLDLLAGLWKTAEPDLPEEEAVAAGTDDDAETPMSTAASRTKALRTAGVALACTALIGGLLTAGVMMAGAQSTEAATVRFDAAELSKQMTEALHRAGLKELTATPRGTNVVVSGIVTNSDGSDTARRIMDTLARGKTLREYDVAQQDIDNIQQSLGNAGARVEYKGNGVFRVSGTVQSLKKFQQLLANVKPDLDENVKRLDVDVKETRSPVPDIRYAEVVSVGSVHYIETPDGTKHLLDTTSTGKESE
ncbi:secretion protein SctD [Paraburkholderia acidicola]|uniref:Secretion protein SctD n=1 Tax=Paraburkholderia acidicola TaxID=1912599 RepID=A0A2A4EPE1_9BURK|nr:HrpD5 family protein [Paraburkholderia acidicola]PCE22537.1 secretion protein SctD [Paraburkholderia acidicola]